MPGKKIFIFPVRYYANCVSTTVTVLVLRNVEGVCFFYSHPVYLTRAHLVGIERKSNKLFTLNSSGVNNSYVFTSHGIGFTE